MARIDRNASLAYLDTNLSRGPKPLRPLVKCQDLGYLESCSDVTSAIHVFRDFDLSSI